MEEIKFLLANKELLKGDESEFLRQHIEKLMGDAESKRNSGKASRSAVGSVGGGYKRRNRTKRKNIKSKRRKRTTKKTTKKTKSRR